MKRSYTPEQRAHKAEHDAAYKLKRRQERKRERDRVSKPIPVRKLHDQTPKVCECEGSYGDKREGTCLKCGKDVKMERRAA
jgi:hypothetical protein